MIYYGSMSSVWIYIMSNKPNGILYIGVDSNLAHRVWEHSDGTVGGFTSKHGLQWLVYAKPHDEIDTAIQRGKNIKQWRRAWKVRLIHSTNLNWDDRYDQLA